MYGRWTKQYIGVLLNRIIPRLTASGKKWWTDRFHFKVLTRENARDIITVDRGISRRDLEQIIPFPMSRTFLLNAPPDLVLYECACRHTRENPCLPTQVCLVIGKPFTDFILKQHPGESRRINQQEALEIVEAEHERGHIQTAWFKDAMGGRFYAMCNCCRCCCFGMEAMTKYDMPMAASSGYVAQVDESRCGACGTCEDLCPFTAIRVNGTSAIDWESCMGCGVCVTQCPDEALTLVRDEGKGIPLDVRLMTEKAMH